MLSVRQSSTDWAKSVTGMMNPLNGTTANIITFARTGTLAPVAIKTATVPLSITAAVQALTNLPSSSEGITLDGNATIGILYL
jgi:hypothetical protein